MVPPPSVHVRAVVQFDSGCVFVCACVFVSHVRSSWALGVCVWVCVCVCVRAACARQLLHEIAPRLEDGVELVSCVVGTRHRYSVVEFAVCVLPTNVEGRADLPCCGRICGCAQL